MFLSHIDELIEDKYGIQVLVLFRSHGERKEKKKRQRMNRRQLNVMIRFRHKKKQKSMLYCNVTKRTFYRVCLRMR